MSDMLTDLDCILIQIYVEKLDADPHEQSMIFLTDMTIDLDSMTAWFESNPDYQFNLIRTDDNNRTRCRLTNKKNDGV